MKALPMRYAGWMARDLLRHPGLIILALALLAIFIEGSVTRTSASFMVVNGVPMERSATSTLLGVQRLGTVFVLLVTAGIVRGDFAGGYHRLLFVKPVNPPGYYLLRWLLGGVAVGLGMLLIDAGIALHLHVPMQGMALLARAGMTYLLIGGLILFCSTLTRRDWLAAVLLMIMHVGIAEARTIGFWSGPLVDAAYHALPPFHLVGMNQPVPSGWPLVHVASYGLALVVGAMAILHWRPLGAGRRE